MAKYHQRRYFVDGKGKGCKICPVTVYRYFWSFKKCGYYDQTIGKG